MVRSWLLMLLMVWYSRVQGLLSDNCLFNNLSCFFKNLFDFTLNKKIHLKKIDKRIDNVFTQRIFNYLLLVFAIFILSTFSETAYAADVSTILNNLKKILKPMTVVLLFISFLTGLFMIFRAIVLFKKFGMSMNMQTQPGEFAGPITYLIVGAALIYLPTTTDVLMNALFGGSTTMFGGGSLDYTAYGQGSQLLGYVTSGSVEQQWAELANTLVLYIQFLGLLSFIKGWIMLGKAGQAGAQPGTFSKAMTHIIGGIIAVNFVGMVKILRNTIYGG